ncbi:MAG: sugar phosphate isomerase/epimerase family protein [Planctomycetaceae bacterium]
MASSRKKSYQIALAAVRRQRPLLSLHKRYQNIPTSRSFAPVDSSRLKSPATSGLLMAQLELGFVSAILPDLSCEDVFNFAAETGYDTVEVMCWPPSKADRRYAGITHLDCTSLSDADVEQMAKLCRDTGVSVSGLGYYPNPLTPDEQQSRAAQEHIRRVIEAAGRLGAGRMNTFVGRDWTKSIDDNWNRFLDVWGPLVDWAAKCDVRIGIENCPMLFGKDEWPGGKNLAVSPRVWRRMFTDIPDPHFGLNYDPSHFILQMMDPLLPLLDFGNRIHHIHAKDVRIDRRQLNDVGCFADPHLWHTPKLPGTGDVNWGQFFSHLTECGYSGPVCVEVEDRAYEGSLEDRKSALVQSATYLRNFIPRR